MARALHGHLSMSPPRPLIGLAALALTLGACSSDPRGIIVPQAKHERRGSATETGRVVVEPRANLQPGTASLARLELVVVAEETHAPLAGVHAQLSVRTSRWGRDVVAEEPATDAEGRAVLELEPGVPHELSLCIGQYSGDYGVPPLAAGQSLKRVVAVPTVLDRTFHGRVVEADTEDPLPEAVVRVENRGACMGQKESVVYPDHDGRFEVPYATWGEFSIRAELEGYRSSQSSPPGYWTPTSAGAPVLIALERGGGYVGPEVCRVGSVPVERDELGERKEQATAAIRGVVTRPDGNVLSRATVCYRRAEEGVDRRYFRREDRAEEISAGRDGTFLVEGLVQGRYWIGFPADWTTAVATAPLAVAVDVTDGETVHVELVARRAMSLQGIVIDDHGVPVAGVRVSTDGVSGETDEEGRFWIGPIGPGEHELVAHPAYHFESRSSLPVVATAGDEDIVLTAWRPARMRGVIHGRRAGEIELWPTDVRYHGSESEWTWSDGRFESADYAAGTYRGFAQTEDGRIQILPELVLVAGETLELELDPEPMAFLEVQVGEAGECPYEMLLEQRGVVVDWGYWQLRGAPGPATLILDDLDESTVDARTPVHLIAGATTEITLTLDE